MMTHITRDDLRERNPPSIEKNRRSARFLDLKPMTVLLLPVKRFLRGMRLPGSTTSQHSALWSRFRGGCINALGCLLLVSSNLQASEKALVSLEWDPNPETNIAGYRLSYGTTLGTYPDFVDVGIGTVRA
jgi:hypothetical protein